MQCKCIICGTGFTKSPSDNVLTCSPECSRRRRSEALTGHSVSDETRQKISSAARERGFTENLAKGTPAARNSPKGGRFDTNASAKSWTLTSPDGRQFTCINLNNWIRTHADLFGMEPTDDNVRRVSAGFRVIKRNIKRNRGGQTYKGWRIDDWDDRKNHEKGENHMKINHKRFHEIVQAAQEQPDMQMFLTEYGLPEWIFAEVTNDEQAAVELLTNIHRVLHSTPKEFIAAAGLNQTKFAARFNIPLRTVQDWCGNRRKMPDYLKFMAAEILGMFKAKITL